MPEITRRVTLRVQPILALLLAVSISAVFLNSAGAQAVPQVTAQVSDTKLATMMGNVHPLAQPKYDQGVVPDSTPTGHVILTLKRSDAQEGALHSFLAEATTKDSPNYHKWLTPAQFGKQFGPADSDVAAVQTWLQSHGFNIEKVGAGRSAIEFSGTAGQVREAFHTELHTYKVQGEVHHANASNPQIPAALTPVIAGVGPLNDFRPKSQMSLLGRATYDSNTHKVTPQWTFSNGSGETYAVSPKDFATQYNLTPLYTAGINGSGQTIGIINDSNIDLDLVSAYRKFYGVDGTSTVPNLPQVIIDGEDPGVNGDAGEAYLDVELAGAVAPKATVNLYIAANTDYAGGLNLAIVRAIEDDTAPVLSLSFGGCEAAQGASGMAFYNSVWEQAAAQGQTVLVSTGDSGSAGCDDANSYEAAYGLQVNGLASTPWNIAVGGTDFYYSDYATGGASATSYWNTKNDANLGSLISPIPEQPWNDSSYGLNTLPIGYPDVAGGGGGQSTCAIAGGPLQGTNPITALGYCTGLGGFPKPAWQAGPGVPKDQVRDIPDVSLFAANGYNFSFYTICASIGDCVPTSAGVVYYSGVGGTSASTPAFAGIMALVNEKYGPQGQANYVLYPLAAQVPSVFHDVTVGSNNQPCDITLTFEPYDLNCSKDASGSGASLQAWAATAGYDLATGLGSVDANALVTNWNKVSFTSTTTTLNATPASVTHGQKVTLTAYVAASSGTGTPSGSVAVISDTTLPANKSQLLLSLDGTGTGATTVDYLPGGTYKLYGQYGGDGTFGSSQSSPVSLTVTPENSTLLTTVNNDSASPAVAVTNGAAIPFGSLIRVSLEPVGVSAPKGQTDGIATGSTTITDNGSTLSINPLDSTGTSSFSSTLLPIGNHSLTFSYSGDASFNATSVSTPVTFTIAKGATSTSLGMSTSYFLYAGGNFVAQTIVQGSYPSGAAGGGGVPPTGNVVVTLSNATNTFTLTSPLVAIGYGQQTTVSGNGVAGGTSSFDNLPVGTYNLTASYAGDSNWSSSSYTLKNWVEVYSTTTQPSTTTLALTSPSSPSNIPPGTSITLVATVSGGPNATVAPTGYLGFLQSGSGYFTCIRTLTPTGKGATSTASCTFSSGNSTPDLSTVYANYIGDSVYNGSTSAVLQYSYTTGDFSILATNPTVTVASGSPGSATLTLASATYNPFTGNVSLSCAVTGGPTGATVLPTCAAPATVAVSPSAQSTATLQITTSFPPSTTQTAMHSHRGLFAMGGGSTLAFVLLLGVPSRKRRWKGLIALMLLVTASGMVIGCSGSGTQPPSTPPASPTLVPAGTYTAVVTANNGLTTHNVKFNIVVQ